jgi:hypothetical protein
LYGATNELEDALATFEGECASVFKFICERNRLPPRWSKNYQRLLYFVALQGSRTLAAFEETELVQQTVFQEIAQRFFSEDDFRLEIPHEETLSIRMNLVDELYRVIQDLEPVLLACSGPSRYIASDHPVALYNKAAISADRSSGWDSEGAIIFLPLCSSKTLVLYDSRVYHPVAGCWRPAVEVPVGNDEAFDLNLLQMINARQNVYFNSATGDNELHQLRFFASRSRPSQRVKIWRFEEPENVDGPEEADGKEFAIPQRQFLKRFKIRSSFSPGRSIGMLRRSVRKKTWIERTRRKVWYCVGLVSFLLGRETVPAAQ